MLFESYPLAEWKLVYRTLHSQLSKQPELIDLAFLADIQTHLQRNARAEGIDVSDHGAWDAWLGNQVVSCDIRMAGRAVIN